MQKPNTTPIVRTGQGDYATDHFFDESSNEKGDVVGLMLIVGFYFIAGIVVGAWLF